MKKKLFVLIIDVTDDLNVIYKYILKILQIHFFLFWSNEKNVCKLEIKNISIPKHRFNFYIFLTSLYVVSLYWWLLILFWWFFQIKSSPKDLYEIFQIQNQISQTKKIFAISKSKISQYLSKHGKDQNLSVYEVFNNMLYNGHKNNHLVTISRSDFRIFFHLRSTIRSMLPTRKKQCV